LETYIVRIYRREAEDPRLMSGIVEASGLPEKKAFVNVDGLVAILSQKQHQGKDRTGLKGEGLRGEKNLRHPGCHSTKTSAGGG
jgi:hypothetical protein